MTTSECDAWMSGQCWWRQCLHPEMLNTSATWLIVKIRALPCIFLTLSLSQPMTPSDSWVLSEEAKCVVQCPRCWVLPSGLYLWEQKQAFRDRWEIGPLMLLWEITLSVWWWMCSQEQFILQLHGGTGKHIQHTYKHTLGCGRGHTLTHSSRHKHIHIVAWHHVSISVLLHRMRHKWHTST